MDQFEREDSSTYTEPERTEAFQPVKEEPAQPAQPPVQQAPKPKKSKAPAVLAVLLVLALASAGVMGWMWYQQSGEVDSVRSDLSTAKNKIAQLESTAAAEAKLDDDSDVTTDTSDSDSEAAIKAALAYAQADVSNAKAKLTTRVMYVKDNFANVAVGPSEGAGGVGMILKKVNDQWVVIFSGQDNPPQMTIDMYAIPKAALLLSN